jgi:CxxC motif-containing protein
MSEVYEFTCVVCPWGCPLRVEGKSISGYSCSRGFKYAQKEQTDPRRDISGSVRVVGGVQNVIPVKTSSPLPKELLLEAAALLDKVVISPPIKTGDIIIKNIAGSGVNFIAARSMDAIGD